MMLSCLSACSVTPVQTDVVYSREDRHHLYQLSNWEFNGRIALQNQQDSWSANIEWKHSPDEDRLKLSGPLGQGAVLIVMRKGYIMIDRGNGRVEFSDRVNDFIRQQVGFFVPVLALRYWVVGLAEPEYGLAELEDGFSQFDWDIHYQHFIPVDEELMPRKITVEKDAAKMKLIIDQWVLNG